MAERFDAIIIGTGQAGPSLAQRMTREGMKTAIIERKLFGGTCVNVGCIPTKTLVASARAAHMARRGADFGVAIDGPIKVDMKQVKARKDGVVAQSNSGVTKWLKTMDNLSVYEGHGRLESATSVRVNGDLLEAERIVLNVGGRAFVPDMPVVGEVDYLTNSSMMEVDFLPEHLLVVGGSYIGLEFAQMYRRFGSRVTVIEMGPRLIGRDDPDVSDAVREILEADGVEVRLDAECIGFRREGEKIAAGVSCEEGPPDVLGSHLLLAVGRFPTPTTWAWRRPASPPTGAASSRSTTSSAPRSPASGRSATATPAAPSPTPPTTTTRSSPPTSSTTTRAGSPTASSATACTSIRRSAASA